MPKLMSKKGAVLYIGNSYYNNWYLSRALRKLGWKADVLSYPSENAVTYTHGHDFNLGDFAIWDQRYRKGSFDFLVKILETHAQGHAGDGAASRTADLRHLPRLLRPPTRWFHALLEPVLLAALRGPTRRLLLKYLLRRLLGTMRQRWHKDTSVLFDVLDCYDILHFTGVNNLRYFHFANPHLFSSMPIGWDIELLRQLGKKIVYSHTGCLDGVSQTSFRAWSRTPVCDICRWRNEPTVCSDERNLRWGSLRNRLTDYQVLLGGNRKDYNESKLIHEVPEFYCLDPAVWRPNLEVPSEYRLSCSNDSVKLCHCVGNMESRTDAQQQNVKCTHIYRQVVERLKSEGYRVELLIFTNVPNNELRFYQVQTDISLDMLTYGFFGASAREAMMLGKPVVCFLRPEWLESMRNEIPEYVDELPIVNATPETVYDVLKDLIEHPEKRNEVGRRSRNFAVKWHSAEAASKRFDRIYSELLSSHQCG